MGRNTGIEWTDATWNPVRGCSRVSEGCRNCYAEGVAGRFSGPGLPYHRLAIMGEHGPRWTGLVEIAENQLGAPIGWKKPKRIFVNSMSDLFHESLPDAEIDRVFGVMLACAVFDNRDNTFQVLTKRAARMRAYLGSDPVELVRRWAAAADGVAQCDDHDVLVSELVLLQAVGAMVAHRSAVETGQSEAASSQ